MMNSRRLIGSPCAPCGIVAGRMGRLEVRIETRQTMGLGGEAR
jgi:hypothetical protein